MAFFLGIDSNETVEFYPEWNYENGEKHIRTDYRTQGGKYYRYKWGDYRQISFDVNFMTASEATLVNSWFDSNTQLLFFVTSGSATEVHSVMIMNDETPLRMFNKPYDNHYKGKIELGTY